MIRKSLAYVALGISLLSVVMVLYWFGAWVGGVEGSQGNLLLVALIAILFGAAYNSLHPERTN